MIDYEHVVYEHNFQKDTLDQAMAIVAKFIKSNKRILTGGMAIDMALRKHKKKLYPDDKFPDYDFYSPEFHVDAYRLGMELFDKLPAGTIVSIIRALHVSTMKVRVNFQDAADITYVPQNLYDTVHTLEYEGFIIVHPHFQMIDQHRALSLPLANPPFETVLHRWKKDIERYTLLYKHFPINLTVLKNDAINKYEIPINTLKGHCISGYSALAFWINSATADGKSADKAAPYTWDLSAAQLTVNLPTDAGFTAMSDNFAELADALTSKNGIKQLYNAILDKVPERYIITEGNKKYVIINSKDSLYSAYELPKFHVSNLQEVLSYTMTIYKFYKNTAANNAYIYARDILIWAVTQYKKTKHNKYLKYLPTVDVYGSTNILAAHTLMRHEFDIRFDDIERTLETPRNAYPEKGKPIPEQFYQFVPSESPLYQFDGEARIK